MNCRGTRVMWRIVVETLESSDAVAIRPSTQPAAAGTQCNRDRVRLRVRLVVTVIGGQNIPNRRAGSAHRAGVLLARPLPRFIGKAAGLAECELQRSQSVH